MKNNFYQTKDLYFAAAIISIGIPLSDYTRDGRIIYFRFGNSLKCEELEKAWLTNKLNVPAFQFTEAIRQLKAIIHGDSQTINLT